MPTKSFSLPAQILIVKDSPETQLAYLKQYLSQAYQLAKFPNPQTYLFNQEQSSLKIATVREAISQASFASYNQNSRFFCFLSADLATQAAQNALLKLIEEPPKNTFCLLLVSNPNKLLATVQSRCLSIDLLSYLKIDLQASKNSQTAQASSNQQTQLNQDLNFLIQFFAQPKTVSYSQLIDLSTAYKDRKQALKLVSLALKTALKNQNQTIKLSLKNKNNALKAFNQAYQDLEANFNVVLTLENALFSVKKAR